MTTTTGKTPLQKLPYPTLSNPAHPDNQKELADYLDDRIVMRFTNEAQRNSTITSPVAGMTAYLSESKAVTTYNGSKWVTHFPDPPRALVRMKFTPCQASTYNTVNIDAAITVGTTVAANQITVSQSGTYLVNARFMMDGQANGPAFAFVGLSSGPQISNVQTPPWSWPGEAILAQSGTMELTAGEGIVAKAYRQNAGNVTDGVLSVTWIAPLSGTTPVRW